MKSIIDEIINRLNPLKIVYKEEVEEVINDLNNDKFDSFFEFTNKYYSDMDYSNILIQLVNSLVSENIIDKKYLNYVNKNFEVTNFEENNVVLEDSIPLNVNEKRIESIETKKEDIEELLLDKERNEIIRKRILEAQVLYIKNTKDFLSNLEKKSPALIYQELLNLGNISYIQHCISNFELDTLKSLLEYFENNTTDKKSMFNGFMKESITHNIHLKENNTK